MAQLTSLFFGMLTRTGPGDEGTDSPIVLTINQGGVDRLNHTFSENTPQEDQEFGQANLYELDVAGRNIDVSQLDDSSIRVGISGDDQWEPELLFLWGAQRGFPPTLPEIVPIAIETGIRTKLSTNDAGAVPSLPLRLVAKGSRNMPINRLMLMTITEGDPRDDGGIIATAFTPHGTDAPIELEVVNDAGVAVKFEIPDTPQKDLERGAANLYFIPVLVPFTRRSLRANSIRLRIKGTDFWTPKSLFLFGLDDASGRPESIVPLVHLPNWTFGSLSTDPDQGVESVNLPLVREPLTLDPGDVVGGTLTQ